MGYWCTYIAYFFNINFKVSFGMIREEQYGSRLVGRIPYANPETAEQMKEISEVLERYVREEAL